MPGGAANVGGGGGSSSATMAANVGGGETLSGRVDTHCHIHERFSPTTLPPTTAEEEPEGWPAALDSCLRDLRLAVTMGTEPDDWARVEALAAAAAARHRDRSARLPPVWPAFGVHPWHAHRVALPPKRLDVVPPTAPDNDHGWPAWCLDLRRYLEQHRTAVVGEIGLDRVATLPGTRECRFDHQLAVFRWQLALAARFQRPVSIHCVRATGPLVDILTDPAQPLPPSISLHSFSGSPDTIKILVNLKRPTTVFFGVSACICLRSVDRARRAIAAIPPDRLLLESDHADPSIVVRDFDAMRDVVAEVKCWPPEEVVQRTADNALRWLLPLPLPS